jgi:hypothetical protein
MLIRSFWQAKTGDKNVLRYGTEGVLPSSRSSHIPSNMYHDLCIHKLQTIYHYNEFYVAIRIYISF